MIFSFLFTHTGLVKDYYFAHMYRKDMYMYRKDT